jgi:hypothetical protein
MKFETFYTPHTDILGRATSKLPRVGVPKAENALKTIRAWVGRDIGDDFRLTLSSFRSPRVGEGELGYR